MSIQRFSVGEKRANCYIYRDEATGHCVVIDPGEMTDALRDAIAAAGVKCFDYILLTHCHYDHVGAAWEVQTMTCAPVVIHALDLPGLGIPPVNRTGAHGRVPKVFPTADIALTDGNRLRVGETVLTLLHTPGHTAGSCCYVTQGLIFSGDTLFYERTGKTDLPTGDAEELRQSLRKLAALEGEFDVLTGHGRNTTLAHERKFIFGQQRR